MRALGITGLIFLILGIIVIILSLFGVNTVLNEFGGGILLFLGGFLFWLSHFQSQKGARLIAKQTAEKDAATGFGMKFVSFLTVYWGLILIVLFFVGFLVYGTMNKMWEKNYWYDTQAQREIGFISFAKMVDDYQKYIQDNEEDFKNQSIVGGTINNYFSKIDDEKIGTYRTLFAKAVDTAKAKGMEVPESLLAHYYLGLIAYEAQQYDEARQHFIVLKDYNDFLLYDRAFLYLGYTYENQKNYDEAIKIYQELTSKYPDSFYTPMALYQIGRCHELKNEFDKAAEIYQGIKSNKVYQNKIEKVAQAEDFRNRLDYAIRRVEVSKIRHQKQKPTFFEMKGDPASVITEGSLGETTDLEMPDKGTTDTDAKKAVNDLLKDIETKPPVDPKAAPAPRTPEAPKTTPKPNR